MVFTHSDDYTYGILQSTIHWAWFVNICSTLKGDPRYTSTTVFDKFPFHRTLISQIFNRSAKQQEILEARRNICHKNNMSLREVHKTIDMPGENPLRQCLHKLDEAVMQAYQIKTESQALRKLFDLNKQIHEAEIQGISMQGPGIPAMFKENAEEWISEDCINP